jgi:hypothetical protein
MSYVNGSTARTERGSAFEQHLICTHRELTPDQQEAAVELVLQHAKALGEAWA